MTSKEIRLLHALALTLKLTRISPSQLSVLTCIASEGSCSFSRIQEVCALSASTTSLHLSTLLANKEIAVVAPELHERKKRYMLTPVGLDLLDRTARASIRRLT